MIIGIPVYDRVDLLDVTGPHEMFGWMTRPKADLRIIGEKGGADVATRDGFTFKTTHGFDEIDTLDPHSQAALLRFVETGESKPVGVTKSRHVDVRLIAATNRDLVAQIAKREFREDLFYRLNVIQIRVPSLRDRAADIAPLLRHYLAWCSQEQGAPCPDVTPGAEALLCAYTWPGNVRQLKNMAERMVVRQSGEAIKIRDLPAEILLATNADGASPSSRGVSY